jgi:parallel beta-helix repeat protein
MNIEMNLRLRRGYMDKRLTSIGIVCVVVILGLLGFITFESEVMSAKTLYVGGIGPLNYSKIQDAIDAANPGDTVYVYHRTYYETVVVNKTINLIGEDKDTTIIDGGGSGDVVRIEKNWVNVSGFTVINGNHHGIVLFHVQNCRIFNNIGSSNDQRGIWLALSSNNNITRNTALNNYIGIGLDSSSWNNITSNDVSNNDYGIWLTNSSWNNITDNIVHSNRADGIQLKYSNNNNLLNNNVFSNGVAGVWLEQSSENTLDGTTMINNGIRIDGGEPEHWNTHDIDISNTVNGKPVYYWKNRTGGKIPAGAGQVILANCTNIRIDEQELTFGTIGVELGFSSNNSIEDNDLSSNNVYGIYLCSSNGNTITGNNASSNQWDGIFLFWSNENNIISNNASFNNVIGVMLGHSSGNNIIGNLVSNNLWGLHLYNDSESNIVTNNIIHSNINFGLWLRYSTRNNIIDNTVSNNNLGIFLDSSSSNNIINNGVSINWDGIYLQSSSNNTIINNRVSINWDGIYLQSSSNNTIISNNVYSNDADGINFYLSSNNKLIGNNVSNNGYGTYLTFSSNNNITANAISANLESIYISSSSNNNIIIGNNVSNNDYGIHIENSLNNSIYHNNILNNTNQAYDDTNNGNEWDNGYPSGGNYWSDFDEPGEGAHDDYQGVDQNFMGSDGIVDLGLPSGGKNPYVIDGDSQDNYPLIKFVKYFFLYEGWNLISIPFIQPDTNLGIVLNSIKGSYDAVQWYNVSDNSDPWKHSSIKKPSHLNDLDDIHHMMGFWIHITQPGGILFQYTGIQPTINQTITLHPGWNLVGYPSFRSYNRTQGLNNITFGTDVDSIWTYNTATKKWEELEPSDYFEIGRGYWVHSKIEKDWDVPL